MLLKELLAAVAKGKAAVVVAALVAGGTSVGVADVSLTASPPAHSQTVSNAASTADETESAEPTDSDSAKPDESESPDTATTGTQPKADGTPNHGTCVSEVAASPNPTGQTHGEMVSNAARFVCKNPGKELGQSTATEHKSASHGQASAHQPQPQSTATGTGNGGQAGTGSGNATTHGQSSQHRKG